MRHDLFAREDSSSYRIISSLDMASGQNTTWFLSRPPATSEEKAIGAAIADRAAAKKKKAEFVLPFTN